MDVNEVLNMIIAFWQLNDENMFDIYTQKLAIKCNLGFTETKTKILNFINQHQIPKLVTGPNRIENQVLKILKQSSKKVV